MIPSRLLRVPFGVLLALLLTQCGTSVYYVRPPDWKDPGRRDSAIAAFSPALKGVRIFIDAGHGGDDRAGIGPNEDVVEADVNLRVALKLREYLKQAGAIVLVSRESDQAVPLESRIEQANVNNADIFVSIHHNAAPDASTNYTATFYHAQPGKPGYKPSSHDLARYIQRDLAYVMGNPGPLASFDGTMSDDLVYPDEGFKVLRDAKMTSVLVECGFYTSAYEEQRLRRTEFNDIEAWGIFRGIGKYLKAGVPVLAYTAPNVFRETRPKLEIEVGGSADVRDESIRVFVDGKEEGFSFNRKTGRIVATPSDDLAQGYHRLSAQVRNRNENSSAPFEIYFAVGAAPAALRYTAEPPVLPKDEKAFSQITVTAVDSAGAALGDDIPIRFVTTAGADTTLFTKHGVVNTALYPGALAKVGFTASNGPVRTEGAVTTSADALYTRGLVMSTDGKPVAKASVRLPGGGGALTNDDGEYVISNSKTDGIEVTITAPGYFGKREAFSGARVQDPVILQPVAKGVLIGKTVLLDLLSPSAIDNASRVDVRVLGQLHDALVASGANAIIVPAGAKTKKARTELLAAHRGDVLIQFGILGNGPKLTVKTNGLQAGKSLADAVLRALPGFTALAAFPSAQRISAAFEEPNMRQLVVLVPVAGPRTYDERAGQQVAWSVASAVYAGLASAEGYKTKGTRVVEASVVDRELKTPAAFVPVELNYALRGVTDAKGVVRFRAVSLTEDDLRVLDPGKYEISGVKTEVVN